MNKQELVTEVAKETGMSMVNVTTVLDTLVGTITSTLKKGDSLQLVGFGTFQRKSRSARIGRNPKTGAELKIAARNVPSFSAGKNFKEAVK